MEGRKGMTEGRKGNKEGIKDKKGQEGRKGGRMQ